ncbi:Hsp20 family protein [Herbaspirillum sp. ST 5-3]|uniref:Hsp20 family protein n=1 Tax=Oxalobacteraceae TaxID=75682 RepID=UPI0014560BA2|nr:Hsp20 family protein [Herbaspirillum sp. ST 5-3]
MARIEQTIEVNVPARTAYNQLLRFEQYPRFMDDVKEVRQVDDTHLHWHTRSGNLDMEWDAEITQQVPDRCIAWRNTNGPRYEGKVELQEMQAERTRMTLTMECDPKQQVLAQHGNAETMIAQRAEHDLGRFKKFIEQVAHPSSEPRTKPREAREAREARDAREQGPVPNETEQRRTGGEAIGKTVGQTASERQEAARSGQAHAGGEEQQSSQAQRKQTAAGGAAQAGNGQAWLPDLLQVWSGPFTVMRRMSEDMDRFFERFMGAPALAGRAMQQAPGSWTPPVETAQRENRFIVCAELAGVKRDDVQVEINNDRLTIEGERHPEAPHAPQELRRSERAYGHFYRVIALPPGANAEAASASMQDGVLEITVPIESHRRHGRRLDIQTPH